MSASQPWPLPTTAIHQHLSHVAPALIKARQGGVLCWWCNQADLAAGKGVIAVTEPSSPDVSPDTSTGPEADLNRDIQLADGTRLTETIKGRLADQARRTANAAKARRVKNSDSEPGVLDLTPLRDLLSELVDELNKLRLRDRVARALRQAADIIDTQTPNP